MQLRNKQDFWSGVMFIILGLAFAWKATSYSMGTAARMGPGYFPYWLGIIMAGIGAIVLLTSFSKKAEILITRQIPIEIRFLYNSSYPSKNIFPVGKQRPSKNLNVSACRLDK